MVISSFNHCKQQRSIYFKPLSKELLINKHPTCFNKIFVINQPVPTWLINNNFKKTSANSLWFHFSKISPEAPISNNTGGLLSKNGLFKILDISVILYCYLICKERRKFIYQIIPVILFSYFLMYNLLEITLLVKLLFEFDFVFRFMKYSTIPSE